MGLFYHGASRGLVDTSFAFVTDLGAGKHPSPLDKT